MAVVETHMCFISPWGGGQENPYVRGTPSDGFANSNFVQQEYPVQITDARPTMGDFSLDTHGFAYQWDPEITDDLLAVLRTSDSDRIPLEYFPLVERLIKNKTGASRVVVFDYTVRRREVDSMAKYDGEVKTKKAMQPAALVHCDQSATGSLRRIYQIMGTEATELLNKRAQIINVWRALNGPVEDWPLAVMDGRTLKVANTHATNLFKHQYDLQGQTVSISHHPEQRWYYLDHQRSDEVTLIKIWDSKEDVEAKICAHAAFPHPKTPANAVLRESIEVRCLVFYDH